MLAGVLRLKAPATKRIPPSRIDEFVRASEGNEAGLSRSAQALVLLLRRAGARRRRRGHHFPLVVHRLDERVRLANRLGWPLCWARGLRPTCDQTRRPRIAFAQR